MSATSSRNQALQKINSDTLSKSNSIRNSWSGNSNKSSINRTSDFAESYENILDTSISDDIFVPGKLASNSERKYAPQCKNNQHSILRTEESNTIYGIGEDSKLIIEENKISRKNSQLDFDTNAFTAPYFMGSECDDYYSLDPESVSNASQSKVPKNNIGNEDHESISKIINEYSQYLTTIVAHLENNVKPLYSKVVEISFELVLNILAIETRILQKDSRKRCERTLENIEAGLILGIGMKHEQENRIEENFRKNTTLCIPSMCNSKNKINSLPSRELAHCNTHFKDDERAIYCLKCNPKESQNTKDWKVDRKTLTILNAWMGLLDFYSKNGRIGYFESKHGKS